MENRDNNLFRERVINRFIYLCKKNYCTNFDFIRSELNLDLLNPENVDKFINEYCSLDNICLQYKDFFRFCKIGDNFVAIDEPFADLIIKLNNLGYSTEFCCSGHLRLVRSSSSRPLQKYKISENVIDSYISFKNQNGVFDLLSDIFYLFTNIELSSFKSVDFSSRYFNIKVSSSKKYSEIFKFIELDGKRIFHRDRIVIRFKYYPKYRKEALRIISSIFDLVLQGNNRESLEKKLPLYPP